MADGEDAVRNHGDGKAEAHEGAQAAPDVKQAFAPRKRSIWGVGYVKRKIKERKAEREKETSDQKALRITASATKWMALFTCVLAILSFLTWWEIHTGGVDTHNLALAARDQATAVKDLAAAEKKQAGASVQQVSAMAAMAMAASEQAAASKALSDTTAKQFTASQRLIESQRASLNVAFGRVINPITFHDGSVSIVFSIIIENPGAIKATHASVRFKSYYSQWGNSMFTEPLQRQRDYCSTELPPSKDWVWRDGKRVNIKGLTDWTFTIEPHATSEQQINFGMGKPADTDIIKWPPADVIHNNPALVVTDRIFPFVVGCVDYESGAMPEKHQTGFIFEIQEAYVDPAVPNAAPTFVHYGVDLPRERVIITQFFFGQGRKY